MLALKRDMNDLNGLLAKEKESMKDGIQHQQDLREAEERFNNLKKFYKALANCADDDSESLASMRLELLRVRSLNLKKDISIIDEMKKGLGEQSQGKSKKSENLQVINDQIKNTLREKRSLFEHNFMVDKEMSSSKFLMKKSMTHGGVRFDLTEIDESDDGRLPGTESRMLRSYAFRKDASHLLTEEKAAKVQAKLDLYLKQV